MPTLHFDGRNYEAQATRGVEELMERDLELLVTANSATNRWRERVKAKHDVSVPPAYHRILLAMYFTNHWTACQLADRVGMRSDTARELLKQMQDEKLVANDEFTIYNITPLGRALART